MGTEFDATGKQKVVVHYVNSPVSCVVQENFGGYFDDLDDLTLAEVIQDQESVYQSLQRNAVSDRARASNANSGSNHGQRRSLDERSSARTPSSDPQVAADEAFARDLQELENHLAGTSIGDISRMEAGKVIQGANSASSSTSHSGLTSANSSAQVAREDDIDPDDMSYEELQQLGEVIGTESRGLPEELIQYLPSTTYKTGLLFSKKEKTECVICRMVYKNKDKLITLPCQHQYHSTCVTTWLKINKVCPICNEEVFGS